MLTALAIIAGRFSDPSSVSVP